MRNSWPIDFLIGTAGTGAATGGSASGWSVACRAWNTLAINPGRSLTATVLLPANAATISAVRASSSGGWLSSFILALVDQSTQAMVGGEAIQPKRAVSSGAMPR